MDHLTPGHKFKRMLAERKKKLRITADPNNKAWAEDGSSFGRKMMEKMGWKEGQGLGLKGDGSTSHIKISVKDDFLGIGASRKDAEQSWLGNSKSYQEVLDRLAKGTQDGQESEKNKARKDRKSDRKDRKKRKSDASNEGYGTSEASVPTATTVSTSSANPRAHRAKFIRNKTVSSYTDSQLQEILGGI